MDDELELAKTEKKLAETQEKQPEKATFNISGDNFFPEMDRAAVAALEDLDKHLDTLRNDGYVHSLKSVRASSKPIKVRGYSCGQSLAGRKNCWMMRPTTWQISPRYFNHQVTRPQTPNPVFPAPRTSRPSGKHDLIPTNFPNYQKSSETLIILGSPLQLLSSSSSRVSSHSTPLTQFPLSTHSLIQHHYFLIDGRLNPFFIPPLSTSKLFGLQFFYRRGDCETPLVSRVSQGLEDQIT
jgi:hypothetical protein